MESFSELISALANLAWPALVAIFSFKFFEPLKGLIDSFRGRKLTIKVGDNELSVEEASEQQRIITADIQSKLAELERSLASGQTVTLSEPPPSTITRRRILWVDDNPKNNSFLVATLQERGHEVDIALTTTDGISQFRNRTYDAVISDMGRPENDRAGIDLAEKIRTYNSDVPVYIYCGSWASKNMRQEALSAGVTEITSSGTTLLSLLPLESTS
ncbi:response regulator [Pseudomonas sp. BMS12]|uniref:response regulator n=1 Tax=Pseudomonas sp. BMS12 TaxID=1796033 RepID=UPI00083B83A2|nr:response regulator [Pseudomonas sp. BMS12]